jgi:hypothetical protein
MGVNIDRGRRRPPGETVGVVDTCCGAAIAILAFNHQTDPVVKVDCSGREDNVD